MEGNAYFKALDDFMHCTKLVAENYKLKADAEGENQVWRMCRDPFERMQAEALKGSLTYPKVYQEHFDRDAVA